MVSKDLLIEIKKAILEAEKKHNKKVEVHYQICLLYTSPSPRDQSLSRMPSSA